MLTVYSIPISLYCAKLRIVLRHKKLKWSEVSPPGGYGSNEYKKIVASGNLPALIDGSLILADSEAIAEYIEEKYPNPPMLPEKTSARAKTRELGRFHDTRLEPEIRKLFNHLAPEKRDQAINEQQSNQISNRLFQLSEVINSPPEDLLLSHCGYPISFAWLDLLTSILPLKINFPQNVRTWAKCIEKIPAVEKELRDYRPRIKEWVDNL